LQDLPQRLLMPVRGGSVIARRPPIIHDLYCILTAQLCLRYQLALDERVIKKGVIINGGCV
jgi:hypothetical protein